MDNIISNHELWANELLTKENKKLNKLKDDAWTDWIEEQLNKEISQEEKELMDQMMKKVMTVRNAIREKHPEGNEFVQDTITCPLCGGLVSFMISDHYNGHIHAVCSNYADGCVKWME